MYGSNKCSGPARTAAISVLATAALLAGCRATQGAMQNLKGRPVSEAIAKLGEPTAGELNASGGQDLTWVTSSGMYGVKPCVKEVRTDKDGIIISWSYRHCF